MALKDVVLPTHIVKFSGGEFTVRGLAPVDISQLISVNRSAIEPLFAQYVTRQPTVEEILDIPVQLITAAPMVMAHAIALAADEKDQIATIVSLPLDVQVEALEQIGRLTFETVGGPKKFAETLRRIWRSGREIAVSIPR